MPTGILIIDKPADWTSHDVTAKLRGVFHERRIGHAGTLDPMATGVLPVFIGRATRAVEFAAGGDKEYIAQLQLGLVTDTQDITGRTLWQTDCHLSPEQLTAVLPRFTGELEQIPPMYSAVKINGQKLYQLARSGKDIARPPRKITIHALQLLSQDSPSVFRLRVRCSKGTYIRTLCHDIGHALGCGGTLASLRRTMACGYTQEQSIPLADVLAAQHPENLLLPVDSCFSALPAYRLQNPQDEQHARNGAALSCPTLPDGNYRVYAPSGEFLLVGSCCGGVLKTTKSFFEVKQPCKINV